MDQQKIGNYLRELRKQKNMTQEELAEHFGVTGRSVSRWETGANLPDLSLLVEIADFYNIDLSDIINGGEADNAPEKDNRINDIVEYADADKEQLKRRIIRNNIIALALITVSMLLYITNDVSFIASETRKLLLGFTLGLSLMILLGNILYFSGKSNCNRTGH